MHIASPPAYSGTLRITRMRHFLITFGITKIVHFLGSLFCASHTKWFLKISVLYETQVSSLLGYNLTLFNPL